MSAEGQDLPVQGRQTAGGRIVGRARARGERGHGGGRRGGRRGRGQRGQAIDDNDEMEDPEGDLEWTNIDIEEEATENEDFLFLEDEGLNIRLDPNSSELDFLELYLTDDFYDLIVRETNRFAAQYIASNPDKADSRYVGLWTDTTKEELKIFFAVVIMMGIIHKPNINSYWSLDELLETPSFSKMMLRDRFKLILKFLHFNDNNTYDPEDPNRDRLHKIRPLLRMLRDRFRNRLLSWKKS